MRGVESDRRNMVRQVKVWNKRMRSFGYQNFVDRWQRDNNFRETMALHKWGSIATYEQIVRFQ